MGSVLILPIFLFVLFHIVVWFIFYLRLCFDGRVSLGLDVLDVVFFAGSPSRVLLRVLMLLVRRFLRIVFRIVRIAISQFRHCNVVTHCYFPWILWVFLVFLVWSGGCVVSLLLLLLGALPFLLRFRAASFLFPLLLSLFLHGSLAVLLLLLHRLPHLVCSGLDLVVSGRHICTVDSGVVRMVL